MTTLLLQILISVIENITFWGTILYLTGTLFHNKIFNSTRNVILILISTIILFFIQKYDNSHLVIGAVLAISQYIIITLIIARTSLKDTLMAVAFTYILHCLLQWPILLLIVRINPSFDIVHSLLSNLFIMVTDFLLTIIIFRFLPIHRFYGKIVKIPNIYLFGFSFFFMFIGVMSPFFKSLSMSPYFVLLFSSIFLSVVVFFVLYFAFQTQTKEQAIHYYETYLPILNNMILSIRKTQHNYNNTIQAITGLAHSYSDYDSLVAALEQYSTQSTKEIIPTQFLHFENKLLTALLYNKYCHALEKQINLNVLIHNHYYNSKLNEFQIVELTGILLDNAIEATSPNNDIFLEIGSTISKNETTSNNLNTPFYITVKNPGPKATQDFIKKIFSTGYTSKTTDTNNHGLGLSYVKALIHRHKGHIEISNEIISNEKKKRDDQYFVISISI